MSPQRTDETVFAATARIYVNSGWVVFPVWPPAGSECSCPKGSSCNSPGKHPLTRRGVHDASGDLDVTARWWSRWPNANIGLPADANGLAILDIDPGKGGERSLERLAKWLAENGTPLPATLTARTGSGGRHLFYAATEGGVKTGANVFGSDMPGLDVRGRGGYVVAAPSTHISGGTYEWIDFFEEPAPWLPVLTTLMEPVRPAARPVRMASRTQPPTRTGASSDRYVEAAFTAEVDAVRDATPGTRNDQLNRAAFSLGQLVAAGRLDKQHVSGQLFRAGVAAGLGEREALATIDSGLRAGAACPRAKEAAA